MSPREGTVEAGRLREAAARLRHDLGKAVRFSAPAERETSPEELRARLRIDVLQTRSGPAGTRTAAEVFDAWRAEEGPVLPRTGPVAEGIERIAALIDFLRGLGPRLRGLSTEELVELDEATLAIARECRRLEAEAASAGGGRP